MPRNGRVLRSRPPLLPPIIALTRNQQGNTEKDAHNDVNLQVPNGLLMLFKLTDFIRTGTSIDAEPIFNTTDRLFFSYCIMKT